MDQNADVARRELWGYLFPGLALVAVGVFAVLNGGNTYVALVILAGLVLSLVGFMKHGGHRRSVVSERSQERG